MVIEIFINWRQILTLRKTSLITLLAAFNLFFSQISLAEEIDEQNIIFTDSIKIIFINMDGERDSDTNRLHEEMKSAQECARYDKENLYKAYMLESTNISATLSDFKSPLTKWFDARYYGDKEVIEILHQTCRGVGLKPDTIEAN